MEIKLSDHFTYKKLLRFALPSIAMMIFTSIYGVVDGLFVANLVGKNEFAAVNFIMPVLIMVGAIGFMFGAGGTAIVARTLGEGDRESANKRFSFITYTTLIIGIVFTVLGVIFMPTLVDLLGASEKMRDSCILYGRIVLGAMPAFMLQNLFQSFFVAAEKPKLGLCVTIIAGVMNMVLDALFVAVFKWGLAGAAFATATSQLTGAVIPIIYFARKNSSLLRLTKCGFYANVLLKSITNGSSELLGNISMSIVTIIYNDRLYDLAKEDGVSAYGVIMYVGFIFAAIFIGYAIGSAPIIGFHYGAKNTAELKSILKKSAVVNFIAGATMTAIGVIFARPLSALFANGDNTLLNMSCEGLRIYSLSFLASGFCIFASSFFTSLGNGAVSAAISFMRTLVFQIVFVLSFSYAFGLHGIWYAMIAVEGCSLIVTLIFLIANRKKYNYF